MGVISAPTDGRDLRKGFESRQRREDLNLPTSLDKLFSEWKVLLGPDDWQNYYDGQEGAERYKLHNLPTKNCFHSGVYELALYLEKSTSRSIKKGARVVPVYVGHTENVRARLQDYGRDGSHLECPHANRKCQQCKNPHITVYQTNLGSLERIVVTSNQELCSSPRLLTRSFDEGYSIAFRWTPTKSKFDAAALEACLLQSYDYAWNKGNNGNRRPGDAFEKLQYVSKARSWYNLFKWINKLQKLREQLDNQATSVSSPDKNTVQMFKVLPICLKKKGTMEKNLPSSELICSEKYDGCAHSKNVVCGIMDGSGNICRSIPPPGRKRYGRGIANEFSSIRNASSIRKHSAVGHACNDSGAKKLTCEFDEGSLSLVCGYPLKNGLKCMVLPEEGRKRCTSHKGSASECHMLMVYNGRILCLRMMTWFFVSEAQANALFLHMLLPRQRFGSSCGEGAHFERVHFVSLSFSFFPDLLIHERRGRSRRLWIYDTMQCIGLTTKGNEAVACNV
ncbi:hypothetical protein GOP47_0028126 [Adiantum capillus-veneris]|nr:hypothetical protein GOP47_0028126 [Adiantum capillus-veneris]